MSTNKNNNHNTNTQTPHEPTHNPTVQNRCGILDRTLVGIPHRSCDSQHDNAPHIHPAPHRHPTARARSLSPNYANIIRPSGRQNTIDKASQFERRRDYTRYSNEKWNENFNDWDRFKLIYEHRGIEVIDHDKIRFILMQIGAHLSKHDDPRGAIAADALLNNLALNRDLIIKNMSDLKRIKIRFEWTFITNNLLHNIWDSFQPLEPVHLLKINMKEYEDRMNHNTDTDTDINMIQTSEPDDGAAMSAEFMKQINKHFPVNDKAETSMTPSIANNDINPPKMSAAFMNQINQHFPVNNDTNMITMAPSFVGPLSPNAQMDQDLNTSSAQDDDIKNNANNLHPNDSKRNDDASEQKPSDSQVKTSTSKTVSTGQTGRTVRRSDRIRARKQKEKEQQQQQHKDTKKHTTTKSENSNKKPSGKRRINQSGCVYDDDSL
eukprot:723975_1